MADEPASTGSEGARRIAAERARQLTKEGWSADHDDDHRDRSLVDAAICYAAAPDELCRCEESAWGTLYRPVWPGSWDDEWDKRPRKRNGDLATPSDAQRIRMLEKAGALIAAEIDRLLREAARE